MHGKRQSTRCLNVMKKERGFVWRVRWNASADGSMDNVRGIFLNGYVKMAVSDSWQHVLYKVENGAQRAFHLWQLRKRSLLRTGECYHNGRTICLQFIEDVLWILVQLYANEYRVDRCPTLSSIFKSELVGADGTILSASFQNGGPIGVAVRIDTDGTVKISKSCHYG